MQRSQSPLGGVRHLVSFPLDLKEADIQRLAGPSIHAEADAWQRGGHVLSPTAGEDALHGEILGTWRRVDQVTVRAASGRLQTQCACRTTDDTGRLCRHAAALLLHWLRAPAAFAPEYAQVDASYAHDQTDETPDEETPVSEFARLLETDTMAHLREIARGRGVRIVARNKAEMVEHLAATLSEPDSVDAALRGLGEEERCALDAVDLISAAERASPHPIGQAYRALGGKGDLQGGAPRALDALVDLGLVIPGERQHQPAYSYVIPRVVAARLQAGAAGPGPLRRRVRLASPVRTAERVSTNARLGLVEVFQVATHELLQGAIGAESPTAPREQSAGAPSGWYTQEITSPATEGSKARWGAHNAVWRLEPVPPLLPPADLGRLTTLTGQSARMMDFALGMMMALGIVDVVPEARRFRLVANAEVLQPVLALPPRERLALLLEVWLALPDSIDFRMVVGSNRRLQLYFQSTYYTPHAHAQPHDAAVRRLLVRLLLRDAGSDDRWYDFNALLDLLWELSPSLLGGPIGGYGEWWFADSRGAGRRLNLETRSDWQRVWAPLVAAILTGPMTWLGLVKVASVQGQEKRHIFRLCPAAASLAGQQVDEQAPTLEPLLLEMNPDEGVPTVVVPGGAPDQSIHTLLAMVGEITEASPAGLRYRLTPTRLQMAFDDGVEGPDLIQSLREHAGGTLPEAMEKFLQQWWDGYGSIRLYDNLALIELGDDILLHELQATTSLQRALIHTFSPRVIAVDPAMVDDLLADLVRLGHTPRVIEEAP